VIGTMTLILVCQLIGEIIVKLTNFPVPGPVIGMVILFCGLLLRRKMPPELETVSGFLHRYLPMLFVPAGVGVITSTDVIIRSWLPLSGAIVLGTAVTIAVTGVVMQFLNRRQIKDQPELRP